MKIIAFAASTSKKSINKQLVEHTLTYFPDAEIRLLDLNDYDMPVFSVDRETEGYPEQARQFLEQFAWGDFFIISMSEHNGNCTAAFKNIFDWSSRIDGKAFGDKPVFLLSTSPGGYGGKNSLQYAITRFPKHAATIVETFSLPLFEQNFSTENGILDEELRKEFLEKVAAVKETVTAS